MRVVAAGHLAERFPGLDRYLALNVGLSRKDDFRGIDIRIDARPTLCRTAGGDAVVQFAEAFHLTLGVPRNSLAAVAKLVGKRSKRSKTPVGVRIVALHDGDLRGRDAGQEIALSF